MSNAKETKVEDQRLFPAAGASVCTAQAADNVYGPWLGFTFFFSQHVDGTDAG